MVNRNLVYLSYGNPLEYKRTIFSVLTFLSWCNEVVGNVRITIYTDRPDYFRPYFGERVEYIKLSASELETMCGVGRFLHRRKVIVIQKTFQLYTNEDVIFIDSDTFFICPATTLFKGINRSESFMHIREYQLKDAIGIFSAFNQGDYPAKFLNYIEGKNFDVANRIMTFTSSNYSWNSGVLGLNCQVKEFMDDILKLTDEFYTASHWFVSEQLAFSLVLQNLTAVRSSEKYVCHYWGKRQKELIDKLLSDYLPTVVPGSEDCSSIRKTTERWNKLILKDWILEQIQIAKASRSWTYALKKIVRFAYVSGINNRTFKDIKKVIVSK